MSASRGSDFYNDFLKDQEWHDGSIHPSSDPALNAPIDANDLKDRLGGLISSIQGYQQALVRQRRKTREIEEQNRMLRAQLAERSREQNELRSQQESRILQLEAELRAAREALLTERSMGEGRPDTRALESSIEQVRLQGLNSHRELMQRMESLSQKVLTPSNSSTGLTGLQTQVYALRDKLEELNSSFAFSMARILRAFEDKSIELQRSLQETSSAVSLELNKNEHAQKIELTVRADQLEQLVQRSEASLNRRIDQRSRWITDLIQEKLTQVCSRLVEQDTERKSLRAEITRLRKEYPLRDLLRAKEAEIARLTLAINTAKAAENALEAQKLEATLSVVERQKAQLERLLGYQARP